MPGALQVPKCEILPRSPFFFPLSYLVPLLIVPIIYGLVSSAYTLGQGWNVPCLSLYSHSALHKELHKC